MAKCKVVKPYGTSFNVIDQRDKIVAIEHSEKLAIKTAKRKARPGEDFFIAKIKKIVQCK